MGYVPVKINRQGQHKVDETGNRHHRLTVIKEYGKSKHRVFLWQCKCDCGNIVIVPGTALRNGHTQSCGCQKIDFATGRWTKPGETALKNIYGVYKRGNAQRRRICFELTLEEFAEVTSKNCHYCGATPANNHIRTRGNGSYVYNGIDRVDNNQGYIMSNIVPCCKRCNYMKLDLGQVEFIKHIESIYNNLMGISRGDELK